MPSFGSLDCLQFALVFRLKRSLCSSLYSTHGNTQICYGHSHGNRAICLVIIYLIFFAELPYSNYFERLIQISFKKVFHWIRYNSTRGDS